MNRSLNNLGMSRYTKENTAEEAENWSNIDSQEILS